MDFYLFLELKWLTSLLCMNNSKSVFKLQLNCNSELVISSSVCAESIYHSICQIVLASEHITESEKLHFAFVFAVLRMSCKSQWTINNIYFFWVNHSQGCCVYVQVIHDITLGTPIQIDYDVNGRPAVVKCTPGTTTYGRLRSVKLRVLYSLMLNVSIWCYSCPLPSIVKSW